MKQVVIIGGGASGLTAGIIAARRGKKVTILDKNNKCGKKILITGNGKCNYWNENMDLSHYHSSSNLLDKFITDERKEKAINFIKSLGIVPNIKNGYYYPFSGSALTIYNALMLECRKLNIEIINNVTIDKIIKKENFIITVNNKTIEAKNVIIATGSKAHLKEELDYNLIKSFNHTTTPILPSLVQLKGEENYFKKWSGIRALVKTSLYIQNKFIKEEEGEIQLTDYGLSGICIFNLSKYASLGLYKKKNVDVCINFMPFTDKPYDFLKNLNSKVYHKTINELLEGFLNYKLVDIILNKAHVKGNILLDNLSKDEEKRLIDSLTNFKVNIKETNDFNHAQTCLGGIPLEEINYNTFESLKVKNLYFTGEIIDIDGDCGGYNLGFAWMSGIVAGSSVK